MKKCANCGHVQETGNYCGKCGSSLGAKEMSQQSGALKTEAETHTEQKVTSTNSNEKMKRLKNESSQYMSHFAKQLKNPSESFFHAASYAKQNLISIAVYLALFAIAIYTLLTKLGYESDVLYVELPSKSSIVFESILSVLLMMGISVLSIFIVNKSFGPEATLKEVVSQCGSFFAVPLIIQVIALLAILVESIDIGIISLGISLTIVTLLIPVFTVIKLLDKHSQRLDGFYAFLISLTIMVLLNAIFYGFLIGSIISGIFDIGF